jgi:hypothetical protein
MKRGCRQAALSAKGEEKMLNHLRVFCSLAFLGMLIAAVPGQAQPGRCRNWSLTMTLTPMPTSSPSAGIYSDGQGSYVDGQQGVGAEMQVCSGYYDAVISMTATKQASRHVTYNFSGSILASNNLTPGWALAGPFTFQTQPLFNVNQLADDSSDLCGTASTPSNNPACYRAAEDYAFTTYMWNTRIVAPDGIAYGLQYVSGDPISNTGEQDLYIPPASLNSPYSTSLVHVHHIPAGASPETWVVTPIQNCAGAIVGVNGTTCHTTTNLKTVPPQYPQYPGVVATLLYGTTTKGTPTNVNVGQFSLPFQMTLTRN